ncbi:RagB/SusD domain protein, partial [gut metagenome]
SDTFKPTQAKEGEVVQFIEKDLVECQADLPESYPAKFAGRATKYTAAGILGRFYMFTHQMKKAEAEFAKIIKSGRYGLMERYEDNFDGLHKNNKESV